MSLGAKILHNTGVHFVGRLISTVLGVLAISLLTRYLGPSAFGEYTTATNFLQFFAIVADFGLTLTALTMLGETSADDEPKLLGNLLSLRVVSMGFFALAPLFVLAFPYTGDVKIGVLVGAAAYAILALNQMAIAVFQRHLAMQYVAIAEVLGRAVLLGAMFAASVLGLGVVAMIAAMLAANAVQVGAMLFLGRGVARVDWSVDMDVWKRIMVRAWPLAATSMLNLVYLKGDVLVLSLYRTESEVGLYGAAYKVLDVLTVIPFMFMGLVLPRLSAAWNNGERELYQGYFQQAFEALVVMGLPLLVGGAILATPMMTLVAGSEFASGGPMLAVLLGALFAVFLSALFGHAVIALGAQKQTIWMYGLVAALTFGGYFWLIPVYGAVAAAWLTVASEVLISLLLAFATWRASRMGLSLRSMGRIVLAAGAMGLVVWIFRAWPVLLVIALGALVYAGMVLALGLIPPRLRGVMKEKFGF